MSPVLGLDGILLSEGEQHMQQKKALSPAFSTQAVNSIKHVFWKRRVSPWPPLGRQS